MDPVAPAPAAAEGIVDKYKRLLTLARSSLEANQAALKEKDAQIDSLSQQLDEERSKRRHGAVSRSAHPQDDGLDATPIPRSLLRRVDADDTLWILVQYEEPAEDAWLSFSSEQELSDYITCTQAGVPLQKPQRSLSQQDSARLEEECRARLERITEEFRRYKLRAEIARKQKDAETRQVRVRIRLWVRVWVRVRRDTCDGSDAAPPPHTPGPSGPPSTILP